MEDNNMKPTMNYGDVPQNNSPTDSSVVGPAMDDSAPSILKKEIDKPESKGIGNTGGTFSQTPPPNYVPYGVNNQPQANGPQNANNQYANQSPNQGGQQYANQAPNQGRPQYSSPNPNQGRSQYTNAVPNQGGQQNANQTQNQGGQQYTNQNQNQSGQQNTNQGTQQNFNPGAAQYAYQGAPSMPYYSYNQKKGGWKKGLLIFGIILAVLIFLGYSINNFFDSMFSSLEPSSNAAVETPNHSYIARIAVEGEITSDMGGDYLSAGTTYDHQFTLDSIDDLIKDSNNKALLIFVDTPGGGVYESDQLYFKIKEYKEKTSRPVYIAMGSMAASGGYYISAPADKIYADRNCWTGSIGVTMGTHYDISKLLKKYGIKAENLTSGRNKAMGSSVEPLTEEQRQIFQSLLDDAYLQFVGIIAEGRGMSVEDVKVLADGRIYTANQAVANGLIDGVATEEETTQLLKDENNLKDVEVVELESYTETSWLDSFLEYRLNPIFDRLGSFAKGDIESALDLAENNDNLPLEYMYKP